MPSEGYILSVLFNIQNYHKIIIYVQDRRKKNIIFAFILNFMIVSTFYKLYLLSHKLMKTYLDQLMNLHGVNHI